MRPQKLWKTDLRSCLPHLRDLQSVCLGSVLHRLFGSREGFGDGSQAHAFAGELVEFLDFVLPPGLAVAFEFVAGGHRGGLKETVGSRE